MTPPRGLARLPFSTRTGCLGQFLPCCVCVCICGAGAGKKGERETLHLNLVALFVGKQKNQIVQVASEGPTRARTEDGDPWWTQNNTGPAEGWRGRKDLNSGLRAPVQCTPSARRENHQPAGRAQWGLGAVWRVLAYCESITFHKEMLTIKRVR